MHSGLALLGVLILLGGLVGYFYEETTTVWGIEISQGYPHRDLGTILILGGIICFAIAVIYNPKKEPTANTIQYEGTASVT
jgi:hypothetical protein